jgi:hypothetical protein
MWITGLSDAVLKDMSYQDRHATHDDIADIGEVLQKCQHGE